MTPAPVTAADLTEEQIYDAAARLLAPLRVCFQALSLPCKERDAARQQVADAINGARP